MLTLNDGRSELWQWDTGRTLAVDADCSQVHFSNKVFGRSIDVDVVDGVAIIPDVLLQTDKDLNVWAFVGTAENGYTKISKTFKVNRRNKPADYVFTPVEQTTIAEIAAIAQSVRDDADAGLFKGDTGATGPKGDPGVAGEAGGYYTPAVTQPDENTLRVAFTPSKEDMPAVADTDITLTAGGGGGGSGEDGGYYAPSVDDAGNLSWTASKTDMPAVDSANIKGPRGDTGATGAQGPAGATGPAGADGKSAYQYAVEGGYTGTETEFAAKLAQEKFANPNALTFTGSVTGTYDGSEAVTVNIPSGGVGDSRLICDITLSEDAYSIEITSDLDGNSFELSEVWIFYEGSCTHTQDTYFSVSSVGNPPKRWITKPEGTSKSGTSRKGCVHGVLMAPGIIRGDIVNINSNSGLYPNSAYNEPVSAYEDKITSLKLFTNEALSYAFVAGFRVRVYGR